MLKKVLCVVLSLVLALGAVSVAAFAATADDLATAVAKLPSDYNAQFYNDKTVAAIQAAKDAAAAATTEAEIDAAIALCDEAYALVTEIAYDGYDAPYYVNRDESKAIVNYNINADVTKVKPGETFDVSVSLSTNFYFGDAMLALAYDHTVFEIQSVVNPDELSGILLFDPPNYNHMDRADNYGFVPMEWNYENEDGETALDKYSLMTMTAMNDDSDVVVDETRTFYPTTETEMFTVTFKVKDDAADGVGKIFIDDTVGFHYFEYETDMDFYEQCFSFTRGWNEILILSEPVKRYDGSTLQHGGLWIDTQAAYDQTMVYGGVGATTYTSTDIYGGQEVEVNGVAVNMEIASTKPADYTGLDAAVAEAANYSASDWTPDSYAALTAAVDAANACSRELTEEEQATVDALEADIYEAIEGLERQQAADCPIVSITPNSEIRYLQYADLNVVVKDAPAMKLRFVDPAGNTVTIANDCNLVKSITDNGDGTETWSIKIPTYKLSEQYSVYVRYYDTGWNEIAYIYDMEAIDPEVLDGRFISYDIVDDYEGAIYFGVNEIIVVTGIDVTKVQFMEKGNTWTYTSATASYVDADGVRTWTIKMNFSSLGDHSFDIRTRTTKSTFTSTGTTMDVTVYSK